MKCSAGLVHFRDILESLVARSLELSADGTGVWTQFRGKDDSCTIMGVLPRICVIVSALNALNNQESTKPHRCVRIYLD